MLRLRFGLMKQCDAGKIANVERPLWMAPGFGYTLDKAFKPHHVSLIWVEAGGRIIRCVVDSDDLLMMSEPIAQADIFYPSHG